LILCAIFALSERKNSTLLHSAFCAIGERKKAECKRSENPLLPQAKWPSARQQRPPQAKA
jgi:hypothetical protein